MWQKRNNAYHAISKSTRGFYVRLATSSRLNIAAHLPTGDVSDFTRRICCRWNCATIRGPARDRWTYQKWCAIHPASQPTSHARAALADATNYQNMNCPTIGMSPINEFTHEGYMDQAFPTLYKHFLHCTLYRADYLAPGKPHNIGAVEYFPHMMNSQDDRFANHGRFRRRYVSLNSVQCWNAVNQETFCI